MSEADKVKIRAMINARRIMKAPKSTPNWVLYMNLFATGSTTGMRECKRLGFDPDANTATYPENFRNL